MKTQQNQTNELYNTVKCAITDGSLFTKVKDAKQVYLANKKKKQETLTESTDEQAY